MARGLSWWLQDFAIDVVEQETGDRSLGESFGLGSVPAHLHI